MSNSNAGKRSIDQSTVEVRPVHGNSSLQTVNINTSISPALYQENQFRWQKLVNLAAQLVEVTGCFIMQLRSKDMKLLVSSETEGNPYHTGDTYPLGQERCCETVFSDKKPLLVSDASNDPKWKNIPPFLQGKLVSYYGLPLLWPGGELFGSLCLLDNKVNNFAGKAAFLCRELHDLLEEDLKNIQASNNLRHEHILSTEKITYQESHDLLTGLLNPYAFKKEAKRILPSQEENIKEKIAVGVLNINFFKKINQQYGYAPADQVLQHIANLLQKMIDNGSVALAGRYGGDKFSFLLTDIHNEKEARLRIEPIYTALEIPLQIGHDFLQVVCTTGFCLFPEGGFDIDELTMKADLIQSRVKEVGSICFYDHAVDSKIQRELLIERSLEQAIHDGEIKVYYQPQINQKGQIISVEALVRWQSPDLGFISPDEFIPAAENMGLIHELGLYIFEIACSDINPVIFADKQLKVSINVSPKQFLHPDFFYLIMNITKEVGIDPKRITIEITENVLLGDPDEVMPIFHALINAGFGLSLDDFGTGYSSLKYLSELPITEVKVDKSFINGILASLQKQLLVKSVIAISDAGKIHVVAEGVETESQAAWLLNNNCDSQQGWLYDKALPLDELLKKYRKTNGKSSANFPLFGRKDIISSILDNANDNNLTLNKEHPKGYQVVDVT